MSYEYVDQYMYIYNIYIYNIYIYACAFCVLGPPWPLEHNYSILQRSLSASTSSSNPHTRTTRTSTSIPRTTVLCRGLYADHTIPDISAPSCDFCELLCVCVF